MRTSGTRSVSQSLGVKAQRHSPRLVLQVKSKESGAVVLIAGGKRPGFRRTEESTEPRGMSTPVHLHSFVFLLCLLLLWCYVGLLTCDINVEATCL